MTYSLDLRKRVVGFVENGGSKAEASRRFGVAYGVWRTGSNVTTLRLGPVR